MQVWLGMSKTPPLEGELVGHPVDEGEQDVEARAQGLLVLAQALHDVLLLLGHDHRGLDQNHDDQGGQYGNGYQGIIHNHLLCQIFLTLKVDREVSAYPTISTVSSLATASSATAFQKLPR